MDPCTVNTTNDSNCLLDDGFGQGPVSIPTWANLLNFLFMMVILVLGIPGNGIIIWVQLKNRQRSSTDCLVLTMAVVDVFLAGFVGTVSALQCVPTIWVKIISDVTCKLYYYVIYSTTFASTQLLGVVAFDRYRNTCRPLSKMFRAQYAVKLSLFIVTNSMIIGSLVFVVFQANLRSNTCTYSEHRQLEGMVFEIVLSLTFLTMLVFVTVCYSKIAHVLHLKYKNKRKQIENSYSRTTPPDIPNQRFSIKSSILGRRFNTKVGVVSSNDKISSFGNNQIEPEISFNRHTVFTRLSESKHSNVKAQTDEKLPSCSKPKSVSPIDLTNFEEERSGKSKKDGETGDMKPCTSQGNDQVVDTKDMITSVTGGSTRLTLRTIADNKLTVEYNRVNRTSKMMFLITTTYTLSWILHWFSGIYLTVDGSKDSSTGMGLYTLFSMAFMVNSISNPLFYIYMSSVFRERVRDLFCK